MYSFNVLQKLTEKLGYHDVDAEDCSKVVNTLLKDWSDEDLIRSIRIRFRAGGGAADDDGEDGTTDYGDFEDVETGEVYKSQLSDEGNTTQDPEAEERRLKKLALRERFDAQYPLPGFLFLICCVLLYQLNRTIGILYKNFHPLCVITN